MAPVVVVVAVLAGAAVALALPPVTGTRSGAAAGERHAGGEVCFEDRSPAARTVPNDAEALPSGGRLRALLTVGAVLGGWFVLGGVVGLLGGVVAGLLAWRALGRVEPAAQRRRREALERQLPHVAELMGSSLAAGASPSTALRLVADSVDPPVREELLQATRLLALGADPVRVWTELGRHAHLGQLGRCLLRASESGASVSEAMHRLAVDLRRQARADLEGRARAVGVKAAAPLGLCLLPAFILLGIVPLVAGSLPVLLGR